MNTDFLSRAFQLAQAVDPHKTGSNPRVGCVVVRDSEIIATGIHSQKGEDHAEVDALKKLEGQDLSDCTVYVTLEPCDCFTGKHTGSCTQLLIDKKVEKVIIGFVDPRFSGKNVQKLKDAGILVETYYDTSHENGLDHKKLNPFYDHFFYTKKSYICLKMAQSLDGKVKRGRGGKEASRDVARNVCTDAGSIEIPALSTHCPALSTQHPIPISNTSSRKIVHQMRAQYQAILTTTKTIREDNARLDVRLESEDLSWKPSNPTVLVLGKKSDIPNSHEFWKIKDREVHFFDTRDIGFVINQAAEMGIASIMTELGPNVATQMLQQNLVDEIQLFIAPALFGDGIALSNESIDLSGFNLETVEDVLGDILVRYKMPGIYK